MRRLGTVALAFLFLMPAIAGCLEDNDVEPISVNDIVVNPITMVGGEFQPFVISAKRDVSVFIPHMVIDPVSNYCLFLLNKINSLKTPKKMLFQ